MVQERRRGQAAAKERINRFLKVESPSGQRKARTLEARAVDGLSAIRYCSQRFRLLRGFL